MNPLTRLLRWLIPVRQAPPRKLAEPNRTIALGRDATHIKLAYAIGEQWFILTFGDTQSGLQQAVVALGDWVALDCGFDARAYCECVMAIDGLLDEWCEWKGEGVIHL